MNTLLARFRALPRAGQWLTLLVVFIAAFFAVIDPVLAARQRYAVEGSRIEASLRAKAQVRARVADSERVVAQGATVFGQPHVPAPSIESSAAFEGRINQVFAAAKVNPRITYRESAPLMPDPPRALAGDRQLDRLVAELSFETDVLSLVSILKDLEHAREVANVSKVSLRKQGGGGGARKPGDAGPLVVNLTIEAWVLAGPRAATRAVAAGGRGGAP